MTITTLICIVLCTFLVLCFAFFTIVYLSEIKREKEIREGIMNMEASQKLENALIPITLSVLPSSSDEGIVEENSNKKGLN